MSSLRDAAAIGASPAPCAVCGDSTTLRGVIYGDGHVPLCSTFCEHAWPNVSRLYDVVRAAEAFVDWSPNDEASKDSSVTFVRAERRLHKAVRDWRRTPHPSTEEKKT